MASKAKLKRALKRAKRDIEGRPPTDSERKRLKSIREMLTGEWDDLDGQLYTLRREGKQRTHECIRLEGARLAIARVQGFLDGAST
jgi:hypothetical protein